MTTQPVLDGSRDGNRGSSPLWPSRGQAGAMWVRVGCEFEYQTAAPTPSLWQIRARPDGVQGLVEQEWSTPSQARWYLDGYGNVCDRLMLPEGRSILRYDALVQVASEQDASDPSASVSN